MLAVIVRAVTIASFVVWKASRNNDPVCRLKICLPVQLPIVTRLYVTSCFLVTAACALEVRHMLHFTCSL